MNNKKRFELGEYVYSNVIYAFGTIVRLKSNVYIVKSDTDPHFGKTHEATANQLRRTQRVHLGNIGDGDII